MECHIQKIGGFQLDTIVEFLKAYYIEIIVCTVVLSLSSLIISIINSVKTTKLARRHAQLMRGVDGKDLEAILNLYLDNVEGVIDSMKNVEMNYNRLSTQIQTCIQKVGIIRYNAFDNVGSNQSYSIALLDNENNGIVLTGLFGRDSSTTYAKPIKQGKSSHPLSEEEKEVILMAME